MLVFCSFIDDIFSVKINELNFENLIEKLHNDLRSEACGQLLKSRIFWFLGRFS